MKTALLLLGLTLPSCAAAILKRNELVGDAVYAAMAGSAMVRWGTAVTEGRLKEKHRTTRERALCQLSDPKLKLVARRQLDDAWQAAAEAIFKTVATGALLRGAESVLEQELQYEAPKGEATPENSEDVKQPRKKRAPRVARGTAAAVILLAQVRSQLGSPL